MVQLLQPQSRQTLVLPFALILQQNRSRFWEDRLAPSPSSLAYSAESNQKAKFQEERDPILNSKQYFGPQRALRIESLPILLEAFLHFLKWQAKDQAFP